MISENFNKLLEIQMERYDAILKDCRPHVESNHEGDAAIHKRIVGDITQLQSLTQEFTKAAQEAVSMDEKRVALKSFGQTSFISTYLWDYLFKNMGTASDFRRGALTKHAEIMGTIREEQITTNVTIGWDLIDEVLKKNKLPEQDNKTDTNNKRKPRPNLKIVK